MLLQSNGEGQRRQKNDSPFKVARFDPSRLNSPSKMGWRYVCDPEDFDETQEGVLKRLDR